MPYGWAMHQLHTEINFWTVRSRGWWQWWWREALWLYILGCHKRNVEYIVKNNKAPGVDSIHALVCVCVCVCGYITARAVSLSLRHNSFGDMVLIGNQRAFFPCGAHSRGTFLTLLCTTPHWKDDPWYMTPTAPPAGWNIYITPSHPTRKKKKLMDSDRAERHALLMERKIMLCAHSTLEKSAKKNGKQNKKKNRPIQLIAVM